MSRRSVSTNKGALLQSNLSKKVTVSLSLARGAYDPASCPQAKSREQKLKPHELLERPHPSGPVKPGPHILPEIIVVHLEPITTIRNRIKMRAILLSPNHFGPGK